VARGRVRDAAAHAGRDPDALVYGYNVGVSVGTGAAPSAGVVSGGPDQVADRLAAFVRAGFTFLNLTTAGDGEEQRERLAKEVIPAVRQLAPR
jgi:alkanesulfonate monooxygenase SsuD/methylene tetrahydromethanopterin reductase-like flavin-dependent oxidoreductase (luciferase family)